MQGWESAHENYLNCELVNKVNKGDVPMLFMMDNY